MSRWFPAIVAILGFIVIGPSLWSGWLFDDASFSCLNGILASDHVSLWQAMLNAFNLWFFSNGRFYPAHIVLKYLVFYFFTDLIAYKAFVICATLAVVELFRRCVQAYTSYWTANLAALIALTTFAVRGYHDSILASFGMLQLVTTCILISLFAFRRWLLDRASPARFISAAGFALAALTYEDSLALVVLYPMIAWSCGKRGKELASYCLPSACVAIALIGLALAMRAIVHLPQTSGYSAHLDPSVVARTAWDQIVSSFPISYWLFDPSGIFDRSDLASFYRNAPVSPFVFVPFLAAAWIAVRAASREQIDAKALSWIGAAVLVAPAFPIAIAAKYQHELKMGLGYVPVFFEGFGFALLACAIAIKAVQRWRAAFVPAAIAIAIATCATITQAANVRLVRESIPPREARSELQRQLVAGLISAVPDGATLGVDSPFDWFSFGDAGPDGITTRGLFFTFSGKRVNLVPASDPRAQYLLRFDKTCACWKVAQR